MACEATLPRRTYSVWVSFSSSSGVEPCGVKPACTSLSFTAHCRSASTNAALSLRTISGHAGGGPYTPNHGSTA